LETIWDYTYDKVGFNKAIKNNLPDAKLVESLKKKIKNHEKRLKQNDKDLNELTLWTLKYKPKATTFKQKESELYEERNIIGKKLEKNRNRLKSLPPLGQVKKNAEEIRKTLLKKFQSKQHLKDMAFGDKKQLLYKFLGGGKKEEDGYWVDGKNRHYGIYVRKGRSGLWHYSIISKLVGYDEELLNRVIKGDNINYDFEDVAERMNKRLNEEMREIEANELYKTNKLEYQHANH
jgi:hypothetical protein